MSATNFKKIGVEVLTGMTRNPDIDQEEVIRYSRCAAMSGNAAMNKIFASVGLAAAPVAGASTGAAPATGGKISSLIFFLVWEENFFVNFSKFVEFEISFNFW